MKNIDYRFWLKTALPTIGLLALLAAAAVPLADRLTTAWFMRDLSIRAQLVASSLIEDIGEPLSEQPTGRLNRQLNRLVKDERLYAIGFCDLSGKITQSSSTFIRNYDCKTESGAELASPEGMPLHVDTIPVTTDDGTTRGTVVVLHDTSFIGRRSVQTQSYIFVALFGGSLLVALITLITTELVRRQWFTRLRKGIAGNRDPRSGHDVTRIIEDIGSMISRMESERKVWSAESLRELMRYDFADGQVIVVSNRAPWIHHLEADGSTRVEQPAGGVVTGIEPLVSACGGIWIAWGSGSADAQTADVNGHIQVPPVSPTYSLRRLFLTPEEVTGYYHGFSNQALYPLCLITHVRPVFNTTDWETYIQVNRRFAEAIIEEAKTEAPVVFIQDYHLALVPQMVREKLPNAIILMFWHIPWPSAELFSICPWGEEILKGMLGAHIVGFHTTAHAHNFMATVQTTLEARVDLPARRITQSGNTTAIRNYPMSVEWENVLIGNGHSLSARQSICERHNLPPDVSIGLGVDRLDYSKGLKERFQAVRRMLELEPNLRGKFCFIQIAAPSRTDLETYQRYASEVREEIDKINALYAGDFPTILLLERHHAKEELLPYFRAADCCFISSLHDGMNLVAKEFVVSREDELGTLVLSRFTGAAETFTDALVVNPYHIDACAQALARAVLMPEPEQRNRMRAMRRHVREHNIYRWAGHLLVDAMEIKRINQHTSSSAVVALNTPDARRSISGK